MELKTLSAEDRRHLQDMLGGGYLHGSCYILAIALHRGTGYSIVGLRRPSKTEIHHAGVRTPAGAFFDGRGEVKDFETFILPFREYPEYELVELTEENLHEQKRIDEHSITSTIDRAQAMWPELPWNENTLGGRVRSFAEELEALSKKHKLWIRSVTVTSRPIISEGHGDEQYIVQPTPDGTSFMLDREISS